MEFQEELVIHLQQVPHKEILEELVKVVEKQDHLAAAELVKQENQEEVQTQSVEMVVQE